MAKSIAKQKDKKSFESKSEILGWFFGFLSFIADAYTIIQIFSNATNVKPIPPWLGMIVWILATFTYFSLLHGHWTKINKNNKYSPSFLGYFFKDLIFYFKQPFYLLPFIILLILLFPSLYVISEVFTEFIGALLFFCIFIFIIVKGTSMMEGTSKPYLKQEVTEKIKKEIISNWDDWEKRIEFEHSLIYIITSHTFMDIINLKNYNESVFIFIFSLYASKHPDIARFGSLWKRQENDEEDISLVASNCLVRHEVLNNDLYFLV
jgi:hypothetical protein